MSSERSPNRLAHEPLLHFLGLAALLFVFNALFSGDGREVITVDTATQEYLIEQRQDLQLRELTPEERKEVIDTFIEEEILVREARKRGFENSSRIRTLLIQNMRFFLASDIPEPTEEELRAFFDENIEEFVSEPTMTFDHAFFRDPDSVPADTLQLLLEGADHRSLGDTDFMTERLIGITEQQLVATFGREPAAEILAIEDELWHGPFLSNEGAHFLRMTERSAAKRPTFEMVKSWIGTQWLQNKNREVTDRAISDMRQNYRVEIAAQEGAAE